MNYGYNKRTPGWKERRKPELVQRLREEILKPDYKPVAGYDNYTPYIEIDGPFGGVTIRRITHINNMDQLVEKADGIYEEVMGIKFKEG